MFGLFKKKKVTYEMKAVVDGAVVPMTEATDPVFSSCALGNGVVIRPTSDVIVAPADGTVTVTMDGSNHAIGLELTGGLEVLIHIGVDTVNLKGEGFEALACPDPDRPVDVEYHHIFQRSDLPMLHCPPAAEISRPCITSFPHTHVSRIKKDELMLILSA